MSERRAPIRPDTRDAFAHALIEFIKGPLIGRHSERPVVVDSSTPLFENGIIDSLGIIDLLAFVETTTGKKVPMRKLDMRFFGTVDRICSAFWDERVRS